MSEKVMLNVRLDEKTEAELQLIQERFECDKTEATRRAIAALAAPLVTPPAPAQPALDPSVIEQIRAAVQGGSLRIIV